MSDDKKEREYVYRCRLCGQLKTGPIGSFSTIDAMLVFMELENGEASVYRPGAMVGKTDFHHCNDGGFGIADLIGVRDHI